MIFVLFEVTVKSGFMDHYLGLAAGLKEELSKAKGLIRSERFSSLAEEGKLLSLSVWESEEAAAEWRNQAAHRMCQRQGHDALFAGYTISVAGKIRSYGNTKRHEAPQDSSKLFG